MSYCLEIQQLNAYYGSSQVLHDVHLHVLSGGITCLLGSNGAGKTSVLRAISNLMVRRTGSINLNNKSILKLAPEDIVRRQVAHVPDGRGTIAQLSVEENLRLGAYTRNDNGVDRDIDKMFRYFPRLKERFHQQAGTLSGGEQQMLAISRALMLRPQLLLLDEPSFGLAPQIITEIFDILSAINQSEEIGMLLVEQNADLALSLADSAYLLESGRIVKHGSPDSFLEDESIRRAYLGH